MIGLYIPVIFYAIAIVASLPISDYVPKTWIYEEVRFFVFLILGIYFLISDFITHFIKRGQ